ncbi:MAG: leucine-rich repeat protein, partial [Alphaproteobacteria bacterium]|nr:leucine-rich repeat protein [Alphaproteobacteria bacterium]
RRAAARLVVRVLPALAVVAAGIAWSGPVFAQATEICRSGRLVEIDAIEMALGKECSAITLGDLHGITSLTVGPTRFGSFRLQNALPANGFRELVNLQTLNLSGHNLRGLSANAFAGLRNLKTLNLSGNELGGPLRSGAHFPANAFAGLANLETLNLSDNERSGARTLTVLPANVFAGLTKLKNLHLQKNGLTTLPANVFAGLTELTEVNLEDNKLTSLPNNLVAGLEKLRRLHLKDNANLQLQPENFNGMETISELGLPGITLSGRPGQLKLTRRNGGLRAEWGTAPGSGAKYLLRWKPRTARTTEHFAALPAAASGANTLTYEITGLRNGTEYSAVVYAIPPRVVNAPSGFSPFFQNNLGWAVKSATPVGPPGMPRLPGALPRESGELAVFWKKPAAVTARASETDITGYRVRWKPAAATAFADANAADVSVSARSHIITGLNNDTTYEVQIAAKSAFGDSDYAGAQGTPRLGICGRTAHVRNAILAAIRGVDFCGAVTDAHLTQVRILALRGNGIRTLRAEDFAGLTNMGHLLIEATEITTLPAGLFGPPARRGQPGNVLHTLHVKGNDKLALLPANAFAELAHLDDLDLSSNKLSNLPANVFAGLGNLKKLNLQISTEVKVLSAFSGYKGITSLPANVFAPLVKLEELDLRRNDLGSLPANVFSGLAELKVLQLGVTKLTALPANVFSGLTKLETLGLHDNMISDLPVDVFASQGNLADLDLSENNNLGALRAGSFNGLSLEKLTVKGLTLPEKPADLRLTPGKDKMRAQWNTANNAYYQLHWKRADEAAYAPGDRVTLGPPAVSGATRAHDITGLDADTEYDVRITALPRSSRATSATSRWSFTEASATTANPPGAPRDFALEARYSGEMHVSWSAPAADGGLARRRIPRALEAGRGDHFRGRGRRRSDRVAAHDQRVGERRRV